MEEAGRGSHSADLTKLVREQAKAEGLGLSVNNKLQSHFSGTGVQVKIPQATFYKHAHLCYTIGLISFI